VHVEGRGKPFRNPLAWHRSTLYQRGFYSDYATEVETAEMVYAEQVVLAHEQRATMLDLVKASAQIAASARDPKLVRPLINKLFDMFEPGKEEQLAKKSAQEDKELRELARRTFKVSLGGSTSVLKVT